MKCNIFDGDCDDHANGAIHEATNMLHWAMCLMPYRPGGRHGHRRRRRDKNTTHNYLLASNYRTFLLTKVVIFIA